MNSLRITALAAVASLGLVACQGNAGPQFGRVTAFLTDSAGPFASATVWVSSVYLVGGAASDSGSDSSGNRVVLSTTPMSFDLLTLQNGVTALLGSASVPVGDYAQLRLVVDSAQVTLAPGTMFADSSTTKSLKVPSGMESGIKVVFGPPLHVTSDSTAITVDFNVADNFVLMGRRGSPNGVLFTPTLKATVTP